MAWKKRVLLALLLVVTIWPLVHLWLVDRYDVDPWQFSGFAMYATPPTYQWVHVIELREDREINLHESWLSPEAQALMQEYRRTRAVFGSLKAPHGLAEQLFADQPEAEGFKILCQRDRVSAEDSLVGVHRAVAYIYKR